MKRRRIALVAIVLIALPAAGSVLLSNTTPVKDGATFNATKGPNIELYGDRDVQLSDPFPTNQSVELTTSDGNVTFTSPAGIVADVRDLGEWINLTNVNLAGEHLAVNPGDRAKVNLSGGVSAFYYRSANGTDGEVDFAYSSSSAIQVTVNGLKTNTDVAAVSGSGNIVDRATTDGSGTATFDLDGAKWIFLQYGLGNRDPYLSSVGPTQDGYRRNRDVTLTATVQDPDGDSINATIYWWDGSTYVQVNRVTGLQSGDSLAGSVASLRGQNKWFVRLNDSSTTVNSTTLFYSTPGKITVLDRNDLSKIDGGNVVIASTESSYRDERTINSGTLDLEGVPNEDLLVNINKSGYLERTLVIDDPTQDTYALLAPDPDGNLDGSSNTVTWNFTLNDKTGNFDPSDTSLIVEKYYLDGYRVIGSDLFGAGNRAQLALKKGEEYRLAVKNIETGDIRTLGRFVMDTSKWPDPIELTINQLDSDTENATEPPVARFEYSPSAPTTYETITFDAVNSSDADGSIAEYKWDFDGDGTTDKTGVTVPFEYQSGGYYDVSLTVVDDDELNDTVTQTIYVNSSTEGPIARFDFSPEAPIDGDQLTLNASNSTDADGSISSYDWDISNDSATTVKSGEEVTYNTSEVVTLTVKLTVTDNSGVTDSVQRDIYIADNSTYANRAPEPRYTYSPTNPAAGEKVTFNASTSSDPDGSVDKYEWDWNNDGVYRGSGVTDTHTFSTNGTYDVRLRITDNGTTQNTTVKTVTVGSGEPTAAPNEKPTAAINYSPSNPAAGEVTTFNASGSSDPDGNISSYEWDLDNDGTTDVRGVSARKKFPSDGLYQVTLTVVDDTGTSDSETIQVKVGDGAALKQTYRWGAEFQDPNKSDRNATIRVFFDFAPDTDVQNLTLTIYEHGKKGNVIYTNTYGSTSSIVHEQPLSGAQVDKTWVVKWSATIDGKQQSGKQVVGGSKTLGKTIPAFWRHVASVGMLLIVAGLFGGVRAQWGAVALPMFAGLLAIIGWLPPAIGIGVIVLSMAVGAGWLAVKQPGRTA